MSGCVGYASSRLTCSKGEPLGVLVLQAIGFSNLALTALPRWEPPLAQPGYQHPGAPTQYGPPAGAPQNYAKGYQPGYVQG